MIVIIPLGGKGERFKNFGYSKPKPLINVLGKEIICWLLDNLNHSLITEIIIPYNSELISFRFEDFLKFKYPKLNFKFIFLLFNMYSNYPVFIHSKNSSCNFSTLLHIIYLLSEIFQLILSLYSNIL